MQITLSVSNYYLQELQKVMKNTKFYEFSSVEVDGLESNVYPLTIKSIPLNI